MTRHHWWGLRHGRLYGEGGREMKRYVTRHRVAERSAGHCGMCLWLLLLERPRQEDHLSPRVPNSLGNTTRYGLRKEKKDKKERGGERKGKRREGERGSKGRRGRSKGEAGMEGERGREERGKREGGTESKQSDILFSL